MSMYVFGIVVAASDETPIGRASATLQVQLPALYPEHRFQFLGRRRRLGTSTRELHGASLCLIVASFSMSHYRVSRAALSHAPSENQRVTGAGLRSRLGDRVAVDGGILRLARVPFSCAWTKLLSVMS